MPRTEAPGGGDALGVTGWPDRQERDLPAQGRRGGGAGGDLGDKRVDEKKAAAQVGSLGRADADFVQKSRTGFSIGGVSPLAHATPPVTLIDRELFRFDEIWAAAGTPTAYSASTRRSSKRSPWSR